MPKVDLVLSDQESSASGKDFWKTRIRVISLGTTILFFSRHSKNWLANWQRNSMAIPHRVYRHFHVCFWGEGIPGLSATILFPITR